MIVLMVHRFRPLLSAGICFVVSNDRSALIQYPLFSALVLFFNP